MDTLLPFALLCFTSFFTLTNPLGTMPVFLTMTHGMTDKERQAVVRRATFVSFITLMVFVFAGQFLFKFFGISTNGFRIAGGAFWKAGSYVAEQGKPAFYATERV